MNKLDTAIDTVTQSLQCDDNDAHDALDILVQAANTSTLTRGRIAAQRVVNCWSGGDLAGAVRLLSIWLENTREEARREA